MALDTQTEVSEIKGRSGADSALTDGQEDISGGVTASIGDVSKLTLYLSTAGAVDVTLELSPDGGSTWFEPRSGSPVSFSASNTEIIEIGYVATDIRLTGTNTTGVNAVLREVV